jgi:CBS domain-containing protein
MKPLGELHVEDYMTPQVVVVSGNELLSEAIQTMEERHVNALPVVNDAGRIIGILTATDLVGISHEIQSDISSLSSASRSTRNFFLKMIAVQGKNTVVADVMTSPVETVSRQDNLIVAARKLVERKFHHLPVTDSFGKVVGILSTTDFVRAVADHGSTLAG